MHLHDVGAAAENIMLTAQFNGIASRWLGAINRDIIRKIFCIPDHLKVDTVIALGHPKMKATLTAFRSSIKYYIDERDVLHVPKRPLKEAMHLNKI